MPGRIDTSPQIQRAVPLQKRDKPPAMKRGVAVDDDRMLPGTMGPDDGTPHSHNSTADPARKASTDRAAFGFATHGPDDRHFHGFSQASSAHPVGHSSKPVPTPRPQSNMASERPPTTLGVAWAANSAPKQRQTNDSVATPQPSSVEERLRNLMMDTQRTTLPVHQYDDGELLLPPPPSRDFGDGVTLGGLAASQANAPRPLGQSADGGFAQSARDHASPEHGYVPSKPSDRRQGPRAETMMQRDTTRSQPDTFARANTSAPSGQYTNYAYVSDSQASSVYSETQRSAHKASDLRSAWNKLYGAVPEWRPVSASAAGVRNGTDRPTAQEEFKRRASQPNTSYHTAPRQSPKGQIPSAPRESPMGQSSSTHQTSGSSSSHQSSYSASGHTTFSTFKPDPGGADQDEAEDEEDKELGSLGTLGPASKYPESAGSRPSSARLTPQTPQGSSFGLREIFQPSSSRPNVLSRTEMRNSPRGPTPVSTRSASRDSLNAGFPPGAAKPSGAISNSSAMNGISSGGGSGGGGGGGLTFRKMSGAMVNPAFTADSVVDDVAGEAGGSTPRSGDGTGMGGSSLGAHSSDRVDPSDSVFDYNRRPMLRGMSESSSNRSVTPPLPPLSPSSSQPGSDPSSPRGGASHHRLNPARPQSAQGFPAPSMFSHQRSRSALSTPKTPDLLVTSATPVPLEESRADGGRGGGNRHYERGSSPGGKHLSVPDRRGNSRTTRGEESRGASRNFARSRSLDDVRESGSESNNLSFDVENTMLMVEPSDLSEMEPSLLNASHNVQPKDARAIRGQLHKLENMYYDVMKLMGAEKTHGKSGRRWSIASSETSSLRRGKHLRGSSSSSRPYGKDIKSIQRRFQRLESHVVTLARTLAHLSSELRAHNTVKRDLEVVKREVRELKKHGATSPDGPTNYVAPFEKFRGWIPSLTNPKRINKLTQFFGQEPPLLEIFLKKLGYERYAKNFANEHIGMIELPYMTEDRLESIGIPMGPRLRILQESQLCFRQENFNIYIV